ncbi:hypothetical protein H9X90_05740 [Faecalicatena contorta]|uniref:hypothetical protein n=1 Tax=Faecalicatena contorta TaxID=39482 RepID=UPI0019602C19|nr:hypothetical protein [Faecalicatena contorta]MBM6685503.1 hypothetical protein [Faecalicatena contorta]MBM6710245.1 hypothetical protein [Faecalicatena contorta]
MKDVDYDKIRGLRSKLICYDDWIPTNKILKLCDGILRIDSNDTKIDESDNYKSDLLKLLSSLQGHGDSLSELVNQFTELSSVSDDFSSDIPSLKKRIKYCKNPLERKSLERQLNAAYKEIKKRR